MHRPPCMLQQCQTRRCVRRSCKPLCTARPCRSAVTQLNLFGYGIAFLAVCWYNFQKLQQVGGLMTAACA